MTDPAATSFQVARKLARSRAEAELERLGFSQTGVGWLGVVSDGHKEAKVTIQLPREFPDALPQIDLQDPQGYPAYAHVERTGKLCLAPPTGLLIDEGRPEQVVHESIQRARNVLFPSEETHRADLETEFLAYWPEADSEGLFSICPAPVSSGPISVASLKGLRPLLAAPNRASAEAWASRVGKTLGQSKPAFAIALRQLFRPPRFGERVTLTGFLRLLNEHAGAGATGVFRTWLNETGLPAYLLVSAPMRDGVQHIEIAALIRDMPGKESGRWRNGFRPGHAPRSRQVAFASRASIARLNVQRFDPPFLVERGGGSPALLDKRVVVVGCGAVGSHTALMLAASGFGRLRFVDHEILGPENVHRHALGADQVSRKKVDGLTDQIQRKYPHVDIASRSESVLDVLLNERDFLTDAVDTVLIAIGDETIERRLNRILPSHLRRVHVWLEPLGLGGHTLVGGMGQPGCYDCLYRADEQHGLVNMSSFADPGQFFQRTIAGCRGTFTPFGAMDAERAAVEAATAVTELALGRTPRPYLHSWLISKSSFAASGHRLSPFGARLDPGSCRHDEQFASATCPTCTQW